MNFGRVVTVHGDGPSPKSRSIAPVYKTQREDPKSCVVKPNGDNEDDGEQIISY